MNFIHDDSGFGDLITIVAEERNLGPGIVEKDYWVTHTLWALHQTGLDVWFKGGTSLSKGFGLIERFSEDLDLKIEAGNVETIPAVSSWKSMGKNATQERERFFSALHSALHIPGADVVIDGTVSDHSHRTARFRVLYPGHRRGDLPAMLSPFVLLEIGNARVTPFVERAMTSFVHAKLDALGQERDFVDNRARRVRCVHPLVTLIEKLDALHRRFPKEAIEPASFVRHYEDAARIIECERTLPPLDDYPHARALAGEMFEQKQIAAIPLSDDPAFNIVGTDRGDAVASAYTAIGPMFWGPRIDLDAACGLVRKWIERNLSRP
jgi:hypothetical protein